jgi:hypothetical protein
MLWCVSFILMLAVRASIAAASFIVLPCDFKRWLEIYSCCRLWCLCGGFRKLSGAKGEGNGTRIGYDSSFTLPVVKNGR